MENQQGAVGHDILGWFYDIPPVSRALLSAAFATTTACYLEFVSPLALYYNYELILSKGQFWRLLSSFLYFGSFSLDFLFHLYFVVRYSKLLEEGNTTHTYIYFYMLYLLLKNMYNIHNVYLLTTGTFRRRTADYIFMLIFCAALIIIFAVTFENFGKIKFLGHPLAFTMVYVWGRAPENVNIRMALFGLFQFNAPYLPWTLLLFSLFIGNPIETDLLGIVVGHIYYFLEYVYPHVADRRGWKTRRILVTPSILHFMCGTGPQAIRVSSYTYIYLFFIYLCFI